MEDLFLIKIPISFDKIIESIIYYNKTPFKYVNIWRTWPHIGEFMMICRYLNNLNSKCIFAAGVKVMILQYIGLAAAEFAMTDIRNISFFAMEERILKKCTKHVFMMDFNESEYISKCPAPLHLMRKLNYFYPYEKRYLQFCMLSRVSAKDYELITEILNVYSKYNFQLNNNEIFDIMIRNYGSGFHCTNLIYLMYERGIITENFYSIFSFGATHDGREQLKIKIDNMEREELVEFIFCCEMITKKINRMKFVENSLKFAIEMFKKNANDILAEYDDILNSISMDPTVIESIMTDFAEISGDLQ